jgi:hypothetical protein
MKRLLVLIIGFCLSNGWLLGQAIETKTALQNIYDQNTIMNLPRGMIKNGVLKRYAFFSNALDKELRQTPEAYAQYKKGRGQTWLGGLSVYAGSVGLSVGVATLSDSRYSDRPAVSISSLLMGTLGIAQGIRWVNQGTNNVNNAVWQHNRAQILKAAANDPNLSTAQIEDAYDKKTIQFVGSGFMQNGRYDNFGFMQQNLGRTLQKSPMAYAHFQKSKTNRLIGLGVSVAGVAAMLTGITGEFSKHVNNGLILGGYVTTLASTHFTLKSSTHLSKAVWFYNRDAVAGN